MQAVILAAGASTRTYPLTLTRPKALLPVAGTTILEHNLVQLSGLVDEAVVVVGYRGGQIRSLLGHDRGGITLRFCSQDAQRGTFDALRAAEPLLRERFLVMNGDDLYSRQDMETVLHRDLAILAATVQDEGRFGIISERNGLLEAIREKPAGVAGLGNTGLYLLSRDVLGHAPAPSPRGELELTDAVAGLAREADIAVETVAGSWIPIGYPWDLLAANELLLAQLQGQDVRGAVEPLATLQGPVRVGEGTVIRNGAYIEGPVTIGSGCTIGPNCFIRPSTAIGDRCRIGNGVEVKNSILFPGVQASHLSYLGDSVIGEAVNVGAGTLLTNLRHDSQPIRSMVRGVLVGTGRRKCGAMIGDGCKLGAGTIIYPGRKLWPGQTTLPGEIVKDDRLPQRTGEHINLSEKEDP